MPKLDKVKPLGSVQLTDRRFELLEFVDHYDEPCSLQASSLATYEKPGTSAVWLGIADERMHLDRDQVTALIAHLQSWLDRDTFDFKA